MASSVPWADRIEAYLRGRAGHKASLVELGAAVPRQNSTGTLSKLLRADQRFKVVGSGSSLAVVLQQIAGGVAVKGTGSADGTNAGGGAAAAARTSGKPARSAAEQQPRAAATRKEQPRAAIPVASAAVPVVLFVAPDPPPALMSPATLHALTNLVGAGVTPPTASAYNAAEAWRGVTLADAASAQCMPERAYLGRLFGDSDSGRNSSNGSEDEDENAREMGEEADTLNVRPGVLEDGAGAEAGSSAKGGRPYADGGERVFLNTHEPFCAVTVGVQGAGKSHTMGVLLEACLLPPVPGTVDTHAPLACMVLHYDTNAAAVCEATGLIEPHAAVVALGAAQPPAADGRAPAHGGAGSGGGPAGGDVCPDAEGGAATRGSSPQGAAGGARAPSPWPCLPRQNMVVLVSPTFFRQRQAFYGGACRVRPLLLRWGSLTAANLRTLMHIDSADPPLYASLMLSRLRRYQRDETLPVFGEFMAEMGKAAMEGQAGPLRQRVELLQALVAESEENRGLVAVLEAADGGAPYDIESYFQPGCMVVVDLTDPFLSRADAAGLFEVLVDRFRAAPLGVPAGDSAGGVGAAGGGAAGGKLLVLDEAHRYMGMASGSGGGGEPDGLTAAIISTVRLMRHDGMRVAISTQSPDSLAPELLELVSFAVVHGFHSEAWFRHLRMRVPMPPSAFARIRRLQPGHALVFARRHAVPGIEPLDLLPLAVRPRLTADRGATRNNSMADSQLTRTATANVE
jgi:hypothetical protein